MAVETDSQYPQPSGQGLIEVLEASDCLRQTFFEATARYVQRPTSTNANRMATCANNASAMFMRALDVIVGDTGTDPDEKGQMIATLLKGDDRERVSIFSNLLPKRTGAFSEDPYDCEELSDLISTGLEMGDDDEVLVEASAQYHSNLAADVGKLTELVGDTPQAKFLRYGKLAGKHAFDVAKVGAGVTLGLLAARLVKDK